MIRIASVIVIVGAAWILPLANAQTPLGSEFTYQDGWPMSSDVGDSNLKL